MTANDRDADSADGGIDLRMHQLTLEASLAVLSSVVQPSLVEFLR